MHLVARGSTGGACLSNSMYLPAPLHLEVVRSRMAEAHVFVGWHQSVLQAATA